MDLGSGGVGGAEETELLGASNGNKSGAKKTETGDQVRQRLAVCLFLHIAGAAIVTQIYPKVVLDFFDNDDGRASNFNGWLAFASSAFQLIAIPCISSASDAVGRRAVLKGSFALNGMVVLALGLTPNSIVAVSICQLVSGVCNVTLPVSQAIIVDLSHWPESEGGGEVTHGLGMIGASFGLAISVGPVIGGALSEFHRGTACLLCAAMSFVSLLSLRYYGWKETAPQCRSQGQTTDSTGGGAAGCCWRCPRRPVVNPFSILKVFLESSLLMQLSLCLFCFSLALNVFSVYYNYFDFRYHWNALEISFFYSALGVLLALTYGVGIRFLVPKRLSESRGVLVGMFMQASSLIMYGLSSRGWMLYPVLLCTPVQYITEPCIQAIMTKLVGDDRQGSLQGAVMSLRILAQGIAAPVYGEVFSFGLSDTVKRAFGVLLPGLSLFLSATFSLAGFFVAWFCLPKTGVALVSGAGTAAVVDTLDVTEVGNGATLPRRATRQGDKPGSPSVATASEVSWASPPPNGHGEEDTMMEPLLKSAAVAPSSS